MDPKASFNLHEGDLIPNASHYRWLIARLIYYSFSPKCYLYCPQIKSVPTQPRLPHLKALHHLLRYLKNNLGQGIFFPPPMNPVKLHTFLDADWGFCVDTRKSTIGFCIFICNSLVSWKVKWQRIIRWRWASSTFCHF